MRKVETQTGRRRSESGSSGSDGSRSSQHAKESKKKKQEEKRFIYDAVKKYICPFYYPEISISIASFAALPALVGDHQYDYYYYFIFFCALTQQNRQHNTTHWLTAFSATNASLAASSRHHV